MGNGVKERSHCPATLSGFQCPCFYIDCCFTHTVHATVFKLVCVPDTAPSQERSLINFILFTPCTVHNQFTTLRPTKCTVLYLSYLYYNITLNIPTCFDPQVIIIREPTKAILHKTKLATFVHRKYYVQESNGSNVDNCL
jgi:hypothetical protein